MIPTRRVTVGDGALAYREKGSGESLLLLHSGFISDSMLPLLDQPSLQDHRMIAYLTAADTRTAILPVVLEAFCGPLRTPLVCWTCWALSRPTLRVIRWAR
jgi:hypothetical protein